MQVEQYPTLPKNQRHLTGGFVEGTIAMTGAADVLSKENDDSTRWTWTISWR
jgi:hypothetical protein